MLKAGVDVVQRFWRRSLTASNESFIAAGFILDRIAKPQPSAAALARFPDELGPVEAVPSFIVFRLYAR